MLDVETYIDDLWLYVVGVAFVGLIVLIFLNLLFLIIKLVFHFKEKKVWIGLNIAIIALFISYIAPAYWDINQQSFRTVKNVVYVMTDIPHEKIHYNMCW